MLGMRGLAAGLAASTVVAVLAAYVSRGNLAALVPDLAVVYMVGAVLGFAYGVLDRLLFFVRRSWKAEGFLLALAALLALNGRGSILVGSTLYGAMVAAVSHPLLGDVVASLAATGLWGIPMVLVYAAVAPRKKREGLLEKIRGPLAAPAPAPQEKGLGGLLGRLRGKGQQPPPPPGWKVCPVCGALNEPENRFCKRCGSPLPA